MERIISITLLIKLKSLLKARMARIPINSGWIEVICGGMFSGKTEELMRRLRRAEIAKMSISIFKPKIDSRYDQGHIVSHNKAVSYTHLRAHET